MAELTLHDIPIGLNMRYSTTTTITTKTEFYLSNWEKILKINVNTEKTTYRHNSTEPHILSQPHRRIEVTTRHELLLRCYLAPKFNVNASPTTNTTSTMWEKR